VQKLFVSGTVRVNGSVAIDDSFSAQVSQLACHGDGVVGSMICGLLKPYIERYNGHAFPLTALPLGEMKIADLSLETGDTVRAKASFTS
jgi:hypothetical protein